MPEFWSFFLILFAALTFTTLFRRLHLPWVLALIMGGVLVGPYGFDVLTVTPTLNFLSEVGLVFLMFMAGIETPLSKLRSGLKPLSFLAFINGAIPFIVGVAIARFFGYEWTTALLTGIVFISSSVALVIPSLEANRLLETRIGNAILTTTILQDIASLILLSIFLQSVQPQTQIPLPLFYLLLFLLLITGRWFVAKVHEFIHLLRGPAYDHFETEVRTIFVLLLGVVLMFQLLGLHAITGGFFAGLILSDAINSEKMREKMHTISYGLFIPIFFVIVGTKTNLGVFTEVDSALLLAVAIVAGSMLSKLISGWLGGHVVGYNETQSRLFAVTSIPQLSTTLAVAFTGLSFGILDQKLVSAMILLSAVTTFITPFLTDRLITRKKDQLFTPPEFIDA